jgi:ferredoxin
MQRTITLIRGGIRRTLARLDGWMNALYGWRLNPIYHSGALTVACFVALLASGIYLLIFYRIGSPYASVGGITEQVWAGRWIRTLHRYASALAILAAVVHALRMFAQGRSWGPRALAWVSGIALLFVFFLCGWTGYVMVWDEQAYVLAAEGARWLDALPIFSEPISRAFVGEQPMPPAFFFLNLFAHIALPVGVALVLWIHVSRLARASLLPPRGLLWGATGVLLAVSVAWPIRMAPEADLLGLPGRVPFDLLYGFWLPLTRPLGAQSVWLLGLLMVGLLMAVPLLTRPSPERRPPASVVNERFCTGCEQCYHDCPYEAIAMVPRSDGREGWVARVDPGLCVSCGICAGSCAPMGVGPPGRTGREQLERVRSFIDRVRPAGNDVVIVACDRGAGGASRDERFLDAPVLSVSCAGSLHTSVIEYLVRAGAGGVLLAACPPRDCWNREGVGYLEARVHAGREAELKERVDRSRVTIAYAAEAEPLRVASALGTFREQIRTLAGATAEEQIDIEAECEVPEVSAAEA